MMKKRKIVYCGQFRDLTGYGVAARSYLSAIDSFLSNSETSEVCFKIYPIDIATNNILDDDMLKLVKKYSFKNQEELSDFLSDGEYDCIWHCTSISPIFIDDRYARKDNLDRCLKEIILGSANNYHLVVWETTKISKEWEEAIEYFGPKKIFTACEFNREVFQKHADEVLVVPHPIDESFLNLKKTPIKMGVHLDDKFKILSMSQWDQRKGFSELIFSYLSEFEKSDNTILILKAYASGDFKNKHDMISEINRIKSMMEPHRSLPDIALISDFVDKKIIKWLYDASDVYATATKGEGFGLTIFESVLSGLPTIVPEKGGHIDYIVPENNYLVSGHFDYADSSNPAYSESSEWFRVSYKSLRNKLRLSYVDWKKGVLKSKGKANQSYLLNNSDYKPINIGEKLITCILRDEGERKLLPNYNTLENKLMSLKDKHKGEVLYLISCGPSLNEYDFDFLRERLKNENVFSIKQAFNYFPKVTDYHFFNCSNLPLTDHSYIKRHYDYTKYKPVVIASSNYDLGKRWHKSQKTDIFFKIPIRTEVNNEFISVTHRFEDYSLENNLTRPCGPGILYETVFYMAAHMGFKEIICIGWDLRQKNANNHDYEHFYGQTKGLLNRGDVLDWEIDVTTKASKPLYYWLKKKGITLKVATSSAVYEGIQRVKL